MRKTLATFVLLALTLLLGSVAQAQQPATKDATAQKPATPKRSKRAAGTTKKTAALLPVLGTQKFTTRQPSDDMLEVAIVAFNSAREGEEESAGEAA